MLVSYLGFEDHFITDLTVLLVSRANNFAATQDERHSNLRQISGTGSCFLHSLLTENATGIANKLSHSMFIIVICTNRNVLVFLGFPCGAVLFYEVEHTTLVHVYSLFD